MLRGSMMAMLLALGASVATDASADAPKPGAIDGAVILRSKVNPKVVLRRFKRLVVFVRPLEGQRLPAPAPAEVHQKDARFEPSFLVVAKGQRVRFVNDDDIFHNVFSYSPTKKFDLGTFKEKTSRTVTFDKPGVVQIHCAIHETMNATIYVAPSGGFTVIDKGNAFALKGLPPGRYELGTWHRRFPAGAAEVTVEPGAVTQVEVELGRKGAR